MIRRSRIDFNACLVEGMVAIRGLLEGRFGKPNPQAALGVAEAMHNLQPNPRLLGKVIEDLEIFRRSNPNQAETWLPQTFAWFDSNKGGDQ
ncbi:MAG: hypothetical protein ABJM90_11340 [Paracoccaceae bacterium]